MRQIENTNNYQHEMMYYTNFNVDWRKNEMAARGPHIQELVILAATLCCNNLTISWQGKLTLNDYIFLQNTDTNTRTNEYKETLLLKGRDRQNFEISLRSAIFYRKSMTHHKICMQMLVFIKISHRVQFICYSIILSQYPYFG